MSSSISGKQYQETLRERLSENAAILKDIGNLASFGMCVLSGEPITLATLIPTILKAAGSAISSSLAIIKAISGKKIDNSELLPDPREKVRILFYTYLQQSYLEALETALRDYNSNNLLDNSKKKISKEDFHGVQKALKLCIKSIHETENFYIFCIDPSEITIPLYDAFTNWLNVSLESSGASPLKVYELSARIASEARKNFHLKLSSDEHNAAWIRRYLVLERVQDIPSITSDLKSIKNSLETWTDPISQLKEKHRMAWEDYSRMMKNYLPWNLTNRCLYGYKRAIVNDNNMLSGGSDYAR